MDIYQNINCYGQTDTHTEKWRIEKRQNCRETKERKRKSVYYCKENVELSMPSKQYYEEGGGEN